MEYIFVGIQMLMNPETMLAIIAGTLTGIVFGALPGLTSTVAVALLIPISFGMDPIAGVALLLSAFVGGNLWRFNSRYSIEYSRNSLVDLYNYGWVSNGEKR